MTDTRYPYTYSCDLIRRGGPINYHGVVLSRSDASQIRELIAKAIGMDDYDLACKLADAQLAHENDPDALQAEAQRLISAIRFNRND